MTLTEIIQLRRTIKPEKFTTRPVEKHILTEMLEAANWAPTHSYTEPWRFKIFAGDIRKKLGEFEADFYKKNTKPEHFLQKKYDKALNRPEKSTYIIAICMNRQTEGKKIIPEVEEIAAVSCAVMNMCLVATQHGVVAYWGSGGSTYSRELKTFLGLEDKDKCLGFLYLGYPENGLARGIRKSDIDTKITWM